MAIERCYLSRLRLRTVLSAAGLAVGLVVNSVASAAQQQPVTGSILQVDRVIRYELLLPVEPERAYAAWTDASHLVAWFTHRAEIAVGVGESYSMGWDEVDLRCMKAANVENRTLSDTGEREVAEDDISRSEIPDLDACDYTGTYLEVEPGEVLAFTWQPPPAIDWPPEHIYSTTVRITFDEIESGTRLLFEHSGFHDFPEMKAYLEAWRSYLFNLRAFLLRTPGGL